MGNPGICTYLMDMVANIEATDREGKAPLINAVHNKHGDIAAALLERGANDNAREPNGWTALMLAATRAE